MSNLSNGAANILKKLVAYSDKAAIIINKPAGLAGQFGNLSRKGNLDEVARALRTHFNLPKPPIPVHRLDTGTTGAWLFALTSSRAKDFYAQFRQRVPSKTYLALVTNGYSVGTNKTLACGRGTIDTGLHVPSLNHKRVRDGRVKMDEQDGRVAVTDWELLGSSKIAPLSLLRLKLYSGVKHQLRVHLASGLGCPILGDVRYQSLVNRPTRQPESFTKLLDGLPFEEDPADRIFLHASSIALHRYRKSGKRFRLQVTVPLPPDFVELCTRAGLYNSLPKECITGAVSVDGEDIPLGKVIPAVGGRWQLDSEDL